MGRPTSHSSEDKPCLFCGEMMTMSQVLPPQYMRPSSWTIRKYCSKACANAGASRALRGRPHSDERRLAIKAKCGANVVKPENRGGNGQLTVEQVALQELLGSEWEFEVVVPTRGCGVDAVPNSYKIDIGHKALRVGVEVDRYFTRQFAPKAKKKAAALNALGWTILYAANKEISRDASSVAARVLSEAFPA